MRRFFASMGLAAALLSVQGFFSAPGLAAETMTGAELTALLANGKVILLGGPGKGYSGTLNITADGKGKGEVKLAGGDIISIEGVWKIKKNKFCRVWKGGRDAGKEVCETWVKTGPKAVDVIAAKKNIGSNSWE